MDYGIIKIVERYADVIRKQYNPLKVYLYGSHAKGENNTHSDIDVAIIFPKLEATKYFDIFGNLFALASDIDERLEPNLFIDDGEISKYSMLYEVVTTGREI